MTHIERACAVQKLHNNHMHILWQSEMRNRIVWHVIHYLKARLEKECFPGKNFRVQLFGSLHHGLFVPGSSKINIDISPEDENSSTDDVQSGRVLQILVSTLQTTPRSDLDGGLMQHPVLVWHRTVHRPWLIILAWDSIPVHISYQNKSGIQVSNFMAQTLTQQSMLRLVLLYWKKSLRSGEGTQYIGPNHGQVSTYALFTILLGHVKDLQTALNLRVYEVIARQIVMAYLRMAPKLMRTMDMLSESVNLTSRSFLAKDMAEALACIPPIM